ncbi:MAG: hypothetical protein LBC99_06160 [Spirochaetota bacterium]|nr:hypothetical protein [Spirochaetota bacterium]
MSAKFTSVWVSDLEDSKSWETGFMGFSRAILANNDPGLKSEYKQQLNEHIRFALDSPSSAIREFGFFYCLAWKKIDLLRSYNRNDAQDILLRALVRLYANYEFKYLDFRLFIFASWEESIAAVSALFEKCLSAAVLDSIAKRFASDLDMLHTINELVCILGVPHSEADALLSGSWQARSARIREAFAREDYASAHDELKILSVFRKIFCDFTEEFGVFLQCHIEYAGYAYMADALSWMLSWSCHNCLQAGIECIMKNGNELMVKVLLRRYAALDEKHPALTKDGQKRGAAVLQTDTAWRLVSFALGSGIEPREGMRELLLLCMDANSRVPYLKLAIRECMKNPKRRPEVYAVFMLLVDTLSITSSDIFDARAEYITQLWDSVSGEASIAHLRNVLDIAEQLVLISGDPFIESEFFLPLLRTYLFSTSVPRSRLALRFANERKRLIPIFKMWLTEPELQNMFVRELESADPQAQIQCLNRIRAIYCRLPTASAYLADRLRKFEQDISASALTEPLKRRILRISRRIAVSVSAADTYRSGYGSG